MSFVNLINKQDQGSIRDIPVYTLIILISALLCQIYWATERPLAKANIMVLPAPPAQTSAQLMGLGDSLAISKIFMLWLQAFDNQPGVSVPFKQLNYARVIHWLERILALDPLSQYPLLAAARIYGVVGDDAKKRQMLAFIYTQFSQDPNRRWPAMYHAIYVAKHKLKDYDLALKFARATSRQITAKDIPPWVKQMDLYILEDMGELESAKVLIGGLLASGAIIDPHELKFLRDRLDRLEQ